MRRLPGVLHGNRRVEQNALSFPSYAAKRMRGSLRIGGAHHFSNRSNDTRSHTCPRPTLRQANWCARRGPRSASHRISLKHWPVDNSGSRTGSKKKEAARTRWGQRWSEVLCVRAAEVSCKQPAMGTESASERVDRRSALGGRLESRRVRRLHLAAPPPRVQPVSGGLHKLFTQPCGTSSNLHYAAVRLVDNYWRPICPRA